MSVQNYIDAIECYPDTPLSIAIKSGDKDKVKNLLLDLNIEDAFGYRALLNIAITTDEKDIVEMLLIKGTNIDCESQNMLSPINIAVSNGNIEIIELLLAKGVDFNSINTMQSYFQSWKYEYTERKDIMKLLLQYGVNINFKPYMQIWPECEYLEQYEYTYLDWFIKYNPLSPVINFLVDNDAKYIDTYSDDNPIIIRIKNRQEKNNNITSAVQLLGIIPRDIVPSIIKFF